MPNIDWQKIVSGYICIGNWSVWGIGMLARWRIGTLAPEFSGLGNSVYSVDSEVRVLASWHVGELGFFGSQGTRRLAYCALSAHEF